MSAAAAATLLLAACSAGGVTPASSDVRVTTSAVSSVATAASPSIATGAADARVDPVARKAAVQALLDRRARALVVGDTAAAGATQAPGAVVPLTDRVAALPLASWQYDVASIDASAPTGLLDVRATLTWSIEGEDAGSRQDERLTLRWSGGAWTVAGERSLGTAKPPWELGALTVVRSGRSVVVAVGAASGRARHAAALLDRAIATVTGVWGDDWRRRAVLVLTATDEQMADGLAEDVAAVRRLGAVTTSIGSVPDDLAPAARIWTRLPVWDSVPDTLRLVLLRHEVTHVASRATFSAAAPLWLEEGYAELVGYRGSGYPLRVSARAFVDDVRAQGAPGALPADSEFTGDRADVAYAGAHVACAVLAARWGDAAMRRIYRLTVTGPGSPRDNLEAALREVTGSGIAGLTRSWRARSLALAG